MGCVSSPALSELEFAHALRCRTDQESLCAGGLFQMSFRSFEVYSLERIFDSSLASELLWQGFALDGVDAVWFELCAAHWFDLIVLIELRASEYKRRDWARTGSRLFNALCLGAGWDARELLNMVTWTRERLT